MLENAKSWYEGNNESKITFTAHYFHILTNVKIFRIYIDHKIIDEKQVIGDMKEWTYQSRMTYIKNRLHLSRMQDMSSFINSQHEGSSFFKKKTEWVKIPVQMTPKRNVELNETYILSLSFFL